MNFNYNLIKGRVAETIIQQLFLELGFHVFNYGMEYATPQMLGKVNNKKSPTAMQIRSMPDFVIQNNITGDLYYLEVKYRSSGKFTRMDLDPNFPYENALFVIVSKEKIQCLSFQELELGKQIMPTTNYHLYKRLEFNDIDRNVVKKYLNYCIRFFKGVK